MNRRSLLEGALWLSAGALGVSVCAKLAVVLQTPAVLPFESVAYAQSAGQMVASGNGYSILSTNTGGESNVLVHDARGEEIVVYRSDPQGVLQLTQRIALQNAFVEGRARFGPSLP
ncbi:MAG: hypothetical protein U0570_02405 [Phycisphaerales bacterium]